VLGRRVIAMMSDVNSEPDVAIAVFLLGELLDSASGNGAGATVAAE